MTKGKQHLWLWAIVLCITALGVYLIMLSLQPPTSRVNSTTNPDAYMTNAVYEDYNDEGVLHAFLKTPKMTHYPEKDSAQFLSPDVVMYTSQGTPWHITAEHGRSIHGSTKIFLWGHVVIHQPPRDGLPATTIKTHQITVYPDKQYAETKQPITILRPGSITQAVGLQADFKTGIFKLLSNSRGQYAPNSQ